MQSGNVPSRLRPLLLEMLFIFLGVTAAFLVDDYRDRREAGARANLLAGAIYQDIGDSRRVQADLVRAIDDGLAAYEAQLASGRHPVPYVVEIRGSLRPPAGVWESAGEIGLRDFADPELLFELSRYYGEQQGTGDNFVRYTEFTELEFWPVALSDATRFYDEAGELRGEFKAHMQQLRDYRNDIARQLEWGAELQERLQLEFPGLRLAPARTSGVYESVVRQR